MFVLPQYGLELLPMIIVGNLHSLGGFTSDAVVDIFAGIGGVRAAQQTEQLCKGARD